MNRTLTIRAKLILMVLTLTVALTTVLSFMAYQNEKDAVMTAIDDKLTIGANDIVTLFPDAYHEKIKGPGTVTDEEYKAYAAQLTDRARRNRFQWLYTYLEVDGRFVTAATSADPTNNSVVPFLNPYEPEDPRLRANLLRAFRERQPFFQEYADEFGQFRSAFVPVVTPNGTVFVAGADVSLAEVNERRGAHLRNTALIGFAVSIVFVLASVVAATRISQPMVELSNVARSLGESNAFTLAEMERKWLVQTAARTGDEVGHLASAFIHLDQMLQEYIANLKATTAAKERVESELNIARSIQMAFLHRQFPAFPERRDFDLFATLEPAKEVGGDLYDFQLVGDDLYFSIGDVSDKGVPAALLMVVTQTLMRAATLSALADPGAMLGRVNVDIVDKNEELMFVTMFCGVLNMQTGKLRYTNAGHNPPLILRANGAAERLILPSGVVLGVQADARYETYSATLAPGDTLLTYTDGVTEAKDPHSHLYSMERLVTLVGSSGQPTAHELVRAVMRSVKEHVKTAPQSDDITILAVSYHGTKEGAK